jgi:hypothetical protein
MRLSQNRKCDDTEDVEGEPRKWRLKKPEELQPSKSKHTQPI